LVSIDLVPLVRVGISSVFQTALVGGCDGGEKDGKGDETDQYEEANQGDCSFI